MEAVVIGAALGLWGELWAGSPIAWAETRDLAACSEGHSSCLLRSSWEILRPDSLQAGLDPSLARGRMLDRSLVGRRFPLLEQWGDVEGSGFLIGNETGDQVLQELSNGPSAENRNPTTSGHLEGRIGAWRAFARMEQVDHFSDANLTRRSAILGSPDISTPSPWRRRAWFGENLPPFSLAGGGAGWRSENRRLEAAYLEGWIWQDLPLSDRLVGWQARQANVQARSGGLRLEQTLRILERMGTAGEVRTLSGMGAWQSGIPGCGIGLDWRLEDASGPGGSGRSIEVAPSLSHFLSYRGFAWSGFHRAGNAGFQFLDTLSREGARGALQWRMSALAAWSDRPDLLREEVESILLDREYQVTKTLHQEYGLMATAGLPLGPARLSVQANPRIAWSPRAFALDSATPDERYGNLRALDGTLWGWTQSVELELPNDFWEARTGLRGNLVEGPPASRLDASPPAWQAFLEGLVRGSTGLEGGARLAWRSRIRVRNLVDSDWSSPPQASVDLWALQRLGRRGLSGKVALLDLTASDRADLPRGGQRRPRLLVALDWQPG